MNPLLQAIKILVADDSPVYRKLVEQALAGKGYEVLYAQSGREAMEMFTEHKPSIVITDWMMPDLNGVQLCGQIREQSQKSYTYIIILTGVTDKEKMVKGLAAGADDYLTKPFHRDELLARIGVGRRIIELQRTIESKNRSLEELALTDSLTGLPNRRAAEDWAARQLSGAERHGFAFWAVMADLDYFKKVNDTYGHAAGDTVLKRFAEVLRTNTRHSDICARIGGEEFLIVLTHSDRAGALIATQRMREQLELERFEFGGVEAQVTASFGIAGYSRYEKQSFTRLLAQADVALYSAKRKGRNRVEVATTAVPGTTPPPTELVTEPVANPLA